MGFIKTLKNVVSKFFPRGTHTGYIEPVRAPADQTTAPASTKKLRVTCNRLDAIAGRVTNDTWQRNRTRSLYSCRAKAKGVELADGRFRSAWDLRCLVLTGMRPQDVPAMGLDA
jgi:hypothetical protein